MQALRVVPLLRESIEQESINEGFLQTGAEVESEKSLGDGEELKTFWPHDNVHPVGLACHHSGIITALSRFALYEAQLEDEVHFQAAPYCDNVEGEALEDVSLS